jgi:hypothetical protein
MEDSIVSVNAYCWFWFLIEEFFCYGTEDACFGARGACLEVVYRKSIMINTCPRANVKFLKYRFSTSV